VDAAGLMNSVTELPVDLRVSSLEHMREVFNFVFHDKRLVSELLVELAYRQHLERDDGYTIQNVLRNLESGRERLDDRIAQLKVPTLIVWGEQDAMIPVASARDFQRLIPGSRLEVIAECGHLPALEKPAELVRHVLNFLEQEQDVRPCTACGALAPEARTGRKISFKSCYSSLHRKARALACDRRK
jgi:pimeloyl-ACP methyl ester carboxylesterase